MEVNNLIYLLFIGMCLLLLIQIILLDFDYLEPSIIFNGMMTVSIFFAVLNVNRWDLFVGADTCLVVLSSMLMFALGALYCKYGLSRQVDPDKRDIKVLYIDNKILILLSILGLIFLYFSFREVYNLSVILGNKEGIANMIKTVRYPFERGEIRFSRLQAYRLLYAETVAYISIYSFLSVCIVKKQFLIKNVLPVLVYIPFTILTTGRQQLLILLIYCSVLFSILYLKKYEISYRAKNRILLICLSVGVFFLAIFLLMGTLTGKTATSSRTPFVIISHYVGLSIPALNNFMETVPLEDMYIGHNTLSGIYSNLRTLGFNLPKPIGFQSFTEFAGINTNVYTALDRYLNDYGLFGTEILMGIFGCLTTFVYNFIMRKSNSIMGIIIYSAYAWILVMSCHEEYILTRLFNTQVLYRCALLYGLLRIIQMTCKKNRD